MKIRTKYLLCVKNEGYRASLEPRKVYKRIPDLEAEARGLVRVADESGEDYIYPFENFIPVSLSQKAQRALSAAG